MKQQLLLQKTDFNQFNNTITINDNLGNEISDFLPQPHLMGRKRLFSLGWSPF